MLDLFVHQPDLPILPGNTFKAGMGLWNWPIVTAIIEFSLFALGLVLYLRSTQAKNTTGKWSVWVMAALLIITHIAGLVSPLPSSVTALGWAAQYQWIFVIIGYWVNRNRTAADSTVITSNTTTLPERIQNHTLV